MSARDLPGDLSSRLPCNDVDDDSYTSMIDSNQHSPPPASPLTTPESHAPLPMVSPPPRQRKITTTRGTHTTTKHVTTPSRHPQPASTPHYTGHTPTQSTQPPQYDRTQLLPHPTAAPQYVLPIKIIPNTSDSIDPSDLQDIATLITQVASPTMCLPILPAIASLFVDPRHRSTFTAIEAYLRTTLEPLRANLPPQPKDVTDILDQ